ncbi:MAG: hypothetical protein AAGA01_00490, partial [Cyanobacteria bacterium P01_E01_bin.43]
MLSDQAEALICYSLQVWMREKRNPQTIHTTQHNPYRGNSGEIRREEKNRGSLLARHSPSIERRFRPAS